MDELAEIGAEIGSDVSFCVYGGTCIGQRARGKSRIFLHRQKCWVILAKPTIGVSTADIYKRLQTSKMEHPDVPGMISAIMENNYHDVCEGLGNVLEQVTLQLVPGGCEH